jgi:hypothetical protein
MEVRDAAVARAARSRTAAAVAGGCTRGAGEDNGAGEDDRAGEDDGAGEDGGPASMLGSMIAALAATANSAAPASPHRTRRRDLGTVARPRDPGTVARPGIVPDSRSVAISASRVVRAVSRTAAAAPAQVARWR